MDEIEMASNLASPSRLGKTKRKSRRNKRKSVRRGGSSASNDSGGTSGSSSSGGAGAATSDSDNTSSSGNKSASSGDESGSSSSHSSGHHHHGRTSAATPADATGASEHGSISIEEFSLEIDPKRAKRGDDPVANSLQLKLVVHRIISALRDSLAEFPSELRNFLLGVRWAIEEREALRGVVQPAVGSFVFLRFICPALTSPHTHGLFRGPPNASAQRFLILLSKVVLNLATGVLFEKEDYMLGLNDFIMSNSVGVKDLLESLSVSQFKPMSSRDAADKSNVKAEEEEEADQVVKIKGATKQNCVKLLYYYLASHRQSIAAMAANGVPAGFGGSERKWRGFLESLVALGVLKPEDIAESAPKNTEKPEAAGDIPPSN